MNTGTFTGNAQFNINPKLSSQLVSLGSLSFSLPVLNLKSGESKLDKNAYKALKTDRYKNIVYKLRSSKVMAGKNKGYLVKTQGDLTVAGVTKSISMDVICTVNPDASITCTGSEKLKMTDYNVEPPKFMAGAMKTGNNITLDFIIVYRK
jgi:polyisoprenoid-binding protein YceI